MNTETLARPELGWKRLDWKLSLAVVAKEPPFSQVRLHDLVWCGLLAVCWLIRAGIKCHFAFVKATVGDSVSAFPPRVEWLQAWAMMFRCSGTFANYLGSILVKVDAAVFDHPAVKRAKDSVRQSGRLAAREKL